MFKIILPLQEAANHPRIDEFLTTPAENLDPEDWRHIDIFSHPTSRFPDRSLVAAGAASPINELTCPPRKPPEVSPAEDNKVTCFDPFGVPEDVLETAEKK